MCPLKVSIGVPFFSGHVSMVTIDRRQEAQWPVWCPQPCFPWWPQTCLLQEVLPTPPNNTGSALATGDNVTPAH